ncbi:hypothetical protein D9613_000388 [Agrocybe pediades]|uniref:Uncharacterized protein n=1 Tax=Agrocybe pediades TaxID=84607 RepID=A0A8H4R2L6_9AGAR|nr:hypothetical protein D9613_000388 [Agrocybe pediades]
MPPGPFALFSFYTTALGVVLGLGRPTLAATPQTQSWYEGNIPPLHLEARGRWGATAVDGDPYQVIPLGTEDLSHTPTAWPAITSSASFEAVTSSSNNDNQLKSTSAAVVTSSSLTTSADSDVGTISRKPPSHVSSHTSVITAASTARLLSSRSASPTSPMFTSTSAATVLIDASPIGADNPNSSGSSSSSSTPIPNTASLGAGVRIATSAWNWMPAVLLLPALFCKVV